ncbi:hypothetical protein AUP68_15177 [Ilyonectria robusta]
MPRGLSQAGKSGKGGKGGKGTSGTTLAPNASDPANQAPNGSNLASNESERACSELSDFQPWVPPNHPSWKPPDTRVQGHRLPNAELEDSQPDEAVGEQLTAWALKRRSCSYPLLPTHARSDPCARRLEECFRRRSYTRPELLRGVQHRVITYAHAHVRSSASWAFVPILARMVPLSTPLSTCGAPIVMRPSTIYTATFDPERTRAARARGALARSTAAFRSTAPVPTVAITPRPSAAHSIVRTPPFVPAPPALARSRSRSDNFLVKDGDAKPKGKKRGRKTTAGRGRKRSALDDDNDILDAIRTVPPKGLRRLADVFYQIADNLEEETDETNGPGRESELLIMTVLFFRWLDSPAPYEGARSRTG